MIRFYQKRISPHKGFCCAYRKLTGGYSCSQYAYKIVQRHGAVGLLRSLPKRFECCKEAYIQLQEEEKKKKEWDICHCGPDVGCDCLSNSDCLGNIPNFDCSPDVGCDCPIPDCSCGFFSRFFYKRMKN